MARKDVMKGLMEEAAEQSAPSPNAPPAPAARVNAAKPRYATGAIGAVSRSIEDLKRRSIVELDPRQIDMAGLKDRLDVDDPDLAALITSIREHGQQVPVLVRVNPNDPERYEVVYGRRRVAALKAIGEPIKALVRDLDDRALVIAQGQENTARKNLSFIEKANFARQMRDAGYDRKTMCDALAMDKTLISRMLSVADRVPVALIEAIGSAPSVGRDRWLALADQIGEADVTQAAQGDSSDARFEAVMAALRAPMRPTPPPKPKTPLSGVDGALGEASKSAGHTVLKLNAKASKGFDDWLIEHLPEIHRSWKDQHGE